MKSSLLHNYQAIPEEIVSQQSKPASNNIRWTILVIIGVVSLFGWFSLSVSDTSFHSIQSNLKSVSNDEIDFSVNRVGYSDLEYFKGTQYSYLVLEGYSGVIEPHNDMQIQISNPVSTSYYSYSICPKSAEFQCVSGKIYVVLSSAISDAFVFSTSPYETFTIEINEYAVGSSLQPLRSSKKSAICLYVRREVRDLTIKDRDLLLDTMYTLWSVSDDEGQKKYGANYHSSTYFVEWHFFNAGQRESDHIHEGAGFLTQHLKLTNAFELSLQSVNPAVTLPYWDFTIEGTAGLPVSESPIFTPEWFGSIPTPKDPVWGFTYANDKMQDAAIPDGRWAYTRAERNYKYSTPNPYGYMRSQWNFNPSPYVSRYTTMSYPLGSCSDYYTLMTLTDWGDFMSDVALKPHGSTHINIGGVYGCGQFLKFYDKGYFDSLEDMAALCNSWGFQMKELFRAGYVELPKSCQAGSLDYYSASQCKINCTAEYSLIANGMHFVKVKTAENMSDAAWAEWYDFVCNGDASLIFEGDHLESSSPVDPSFWVIHPLQERALHLKLNQGDLGDLEWPTVRFDVCQKSTCYYNGTKQKNNFCCYGHYADDQTMSFMTNDKYTGFGLTNQEIWDATNAVSDTYSNPFIYDSLRMTHCNSTVL